MEEESKAMVRARDLVEIVLTLIECLLPSCSLFNEFSVENSLNREQEGRRQGTTLLAILGIKGCALHALHQQFLAQHPA
jgi:hypothetical protein